MRRYLDLFTGLLVVRQLQPWHENLNKRQVKAPKVYIRDSGLLHVLLGIRTEKELLTHPRIGASWEGYAVEEVFSQLQPDQAYFSATHQGAELDLLLFKNGRRLGIEIKRADAPILTPSMRSALADLKLEQLIVLYPGSKAYELEPPYVCCQSVRWPARLSKPCSRRSAGHVPRPRCGSDTSPRSPARWMLSRAGIINVYQYGDETLDFGGGRRCCGE